MQTLDKYIKQARSAWEHRFNVTGAALGFLLMVLAAPALAEEPETCRYGATILRNVQGYTVQLEPVPLPGTERLFTCRAVILSASGGQIFSADDWRIDIQEATGTGLNGDGSPEVVLEGFSGGPHCCWTYWIVSLGHEPELLAEIENRRSISLEDINQDGRTEIRAQDGAFDSFLFSHAETVYPTVILRLEEKALKDVGAEFWPFYQEEAEQALGALEESDAQVFRAAKPEEIRMYISTANAVMRLVFAYLYSGREEQARQVLTTFWPQEDSERMWESILYKRRNGILRYVKE